MNGSRFEEGDLLKSACGDYGIVSKTGIRPDDEVPGFYAFWFKEGMSFWMSDDELEISLAVKNRDIDT